MTKKILIVDDEPRLLRGFQRRLGQTFDLTSAESGVQAIKEIETSGPYAVICSDMRMPEMTGVELLDQAKMLCPNTVRVMLTGNSEQQTAIDAVNEGAIFRFLTKPCSPETLAQVFEDSLRQYELVTAEKELLNKTLGGTISLMTEMLSNTKPLAFGRTNRVVALVEVLCRELGIVDAWTVRLAAMLSQVGCTTVPDEVLEKVYSEKPLTDAEMAMYQGHPQRGFELVNKIPRLQDVANIIVNQEQPFGAETDESDSSTPELPFGARILKVALDFDTLNFSLDSSEAFQKIRKRSRTYDPTVIEALGRSLSIIGDGWELVKVKVDSLEQTMIPDEHIISKSSGQILVARGAPLTSTVIERLRNYCSSSLGVEEPICVKVRRTS